MLWFKKTTYLGCTRTEIYGGNWFKLFCSFTNRLYFMVKIGQKTKTMSLYMCLSPMCVCVCACTWRCVLDFVIGSVCVQLLPASCFMPHWGPYWLVQFLFVFSPLFWSSDAALRNPLAFAKTALTAPEAFGKIALNGQTDCGQKALNGERALW